MLVLKMLLSDQDETKQYDELRRSVMKKNGDLALSSRNESGLFDSDKKS
jgi:hypothetical protein